MASSWEELATDTLGSANATIDSGSFTAKKYLRVAIYGNASTGAGDVGLQFNGNSEAVYGRNYQTNNGTNGSNHSSTSINNCAGGEGGRDPFFSDFTIINILDSQKLVVGNLIFEESGNGAEYVPSRRVWSGKWYKVDQQITSVQLITTEDTFDAGSSITVWGADDAPLVYPNLPNGSVFITSDSNEHFMWNSSAETWHEVA